MKVFSRLTSLHGLGLCLAMLLPQPPGHAAVTAGGLAVIGYTDNAATDSFTIVALEEIAAGQVVYVTNNGWGNTNSAFDGASPSGQFGAGAEQLMKLEFTSSVAAGSVISSASNGTGYTWTTAGLIPTGNVANTQQFSALDLKYNGGFVDEIYLFQASGINPLLNVSNFVYAIDMGDPIEFPSGFVEISGSAVGGNVPDGTVSLDGGFSFYNVDTVALGDNDEPNDHTAFELDPLSGFYGGTFGLDWTDPDVIALQMIGGTQEEWLAIIADSSNWSALGSQPNQNFLMAGVPEPSRAMLLLLGGLSVVLRRRRKCE